jgi:integron integrase
MSSLGSIVDQIELKGCCAVIRRREKGATPTGDPRLGPYGDCALRPGALPGASEPYLRVREPEEPYRPAPTRRLLDQVRDAIRARHMSPRTEEAYAHWIRRFILFNSKRHPNEMGPAEITAFLTALAVERCVSASTQNQALAALLFLYRDVRGRPPGWLDGIVRATRPQRLPVVLSRQEVSGLLAALDGAQWILAMLLYGAGLRLRECLRLRVKDLDFDRNEILVREGKGNKDRVTMLPAIVKEPLVAHLERVRAVHERDLKAGFGRVQLPDALASKSPNASREWGWQCATARRSASTSTNRGCRKPFTPPRVRHASQSPSGPTRCASASPPIFSPRATTFVPSRSSSATRTWPRR